MKFQRIISLVLILALTNNARAQALTFDAPNFAGVLGMIAQASEQIKRMSDLVGAAKDQLQTLQKVSAGIRDLKNVISGGVQGIMGTVGDQLGLKDVFAVGKGLQGLVTDGMGLYRSARELPADAKRQLKDIGLAVEDVQKYLADGLVYDAFSGMQVDEWRTIFKDPVDAFANGAVGRAIVRTEAYLDTDDLRRQYAEKLANLSPSERERLSGVAGVDMALLNFSSWSKGLEKRVVNSLNYSVVADKLLTAAGAQETLGGAMAEGNAISASELKAQADANRAQAEADAVTAGLMGSQTRIMNDKQTRANNADTTSSILARP